MTVFCVGILVLDRVYALGVLPSGGGKHLSRSYRETGGGMAATAALAVGRLGGRASWAGPLGDDAAGQSLLRQLAEAGVDTRPAQVLRGVRTPISVVLVQPDGERCLILDRDPALSMIDTDLPPETRAVLADPRYPGPALHALRLARRAGVPAVLDAEVASGEALVGLVEAATHPVFSRAGLREFTGEFDPAAGLHHVGRNGAGVTLGPEGSLFLLDGRVEPLSAPSVAAQDTTGCGDVFHGAFTLGLAEGMDLRRAARFATAAASIKAERGAGWAGIPDRAAVERLLHRGWP